MGAILRKYNAATTILFPLIDRDALDFESTPVAFVAADTQTSRDEAPFVNTGSTPAHEGNGIYSLALTAAELLAARVVITVIDAATKLWEDQAILIETYGHGSAQHAFDLDVARQDVNITAINASTAAAIRLGLSAGQIIPFTVDDAPPVRGKVFVHHEHQLVSLCLSEIPTRYRHFYYPPDS